MVYTASVANPLDQPTYHRDLFLLQRLSRFFAFLIYLELSKSIFDVLKTVGDFIANSLAIVAEH